MPDRTRQELMGYVPSDPVIAGVLEQAWTILAGSGAAADLEELHLFVLNPAEASPALMNSRYFTQSAQALRDEMLIVVNETFLLELEAAIRSFAQAESLLGSPYLKGDEPMFGLIQRIEQDPSRYLARIRRHALRVGAAAEDQIRRELVLVTVFLLGHELGHLASRHADSQFGAFVDPNAPIDEQLEDAVVKLCRHVDEFASRDFGLPGFERVADENSEVRQIAAAYRARHEARFAKEDVFFSNEADADASANQVVIAYLQSLGDGSDEELYLLGCGLFAAALYTWYRDQLALFRHLKVGSLADFSLTAMGRPEFYVHAAALFGVHHRSTLLRAALALEAILRARTDWFERPKETRSLHCAEGAPKKEWWLCESLQRYVLVCVCMDTAVKMAHVGCMAGKRAQKGGALLMMEFEEIHHAVRRLGRLR